MSEKQEIRYLKAEIAGIYPVKVRQIGEEQTVYLLLLETPEWKEKALPIIIGESEGFSIQSALAGLKYERPLTHDLIVSILEALGVEVEKVSIDALLNNSVYTATLVLRREVDGRLEEISIDTRPSDGIAIAVRTGAPIYVADHLEKYARSIDEVGNITW
ncbi:MAG: bifunctional nuclease family protein [Thermofilum sp.]|nr:bifunctional nuclease family protein [Thermofilum sp.]